MVKLKRDLNKNKEIVFPKCGHVSSMQETLSGINKGIYIIVQEFILTETLVINILIISHNNCRNNCQIKNIFNI